MSLVTIRYTYVHDVFTGVSTRGSTRGSGGSSLRLRKICLMALYLTAHCLKFRLSKAKMTKYIKWLK